MKSRVPLSNSHLSGKEKIYVQDAIENNELTYGNNLNSFQDSLETYLGNDKRKNFENKKYFIHLEKQFRKSVFFCLFLMYFDFF